ncbi:MAG TPA: glutamate--cysteine ligase [Alphaproteobacteria bacterium]|nr:glutamate--cysteine ligase [Alphaproteobacteria bacterium]
MSGPSQPSTESITDKRQLVDYVAGGSKPRDKWRVGTEHEKFAYDLDTHRPLPYDGPNGIGEILKRLTKFGWEPVKEGGNIIALTQNGASITLEPGGQFELSGAPLENVHQTCEEVHEHLDQVKGIGAELGTGMLGLGFNPLWRREDIPWMPKGRYKIMSAYMPKVGTLGLDMMLRTCTIQANLDYESEADMVKKFRVGLALQPVATALFASSPFVEGKPSGYLSYRSHVWTDTDAARTGDLPFVFEQGFSFERYVDYLLDVPMYFVYREGKYIDAAGQSFRDFMAGKLPALPGQAPTMGDWVDHMTTAFPEVRLKRYLEMRGADGGPWRRICAVPALWVGLLYDSAALGAAWDLVKDWTDEERAFLRREVPKTGLATMFRGKPLKILARQTVAIARQGLAARKRYDYLGRDEGRFLDELTEMAERGRTLADDMLVKYEGDWQREVDPVFKDYAY